MGVTGARATGQRRRAGAGRPDPRGHRPAGLRRARRLDRRRRRPRSPRSPTASSSARRSSARLLDAGRPAAGVEARRWPPSWPRASAARWSVARRAAAGTPVRSGVRWSRLAGPPARSPCCCGRAARSGRPTARGWRRRAPTARRGRIHARPARPAPPVRPCPAPYATPERSTDTAGARPCDVVTATGAADLVFFGYTHCPDVCSWCWPTSTAALRRLEPALREQVRCVFVTTDPARDTPPVLRDLPRPVRPDVRRAHRPRCRPSRRRRRAPRRARSSRPRKLPSGGYEVGHGDAGDRLSARRHGAGGVDRRAPRSATCAARPRRELVAAAVDRRHDAGERSR